MSSHDEDEAVEFFEKLAGRSSPDKTSANDRGVVALRDALRNQIETMRAAEAANASDLSASELAKMDALRQQLLDKGLIGKPTAENAKQAAATRPNWAQWLRDALLGTGWQRPFAVAASLVMVVTLAVLMSRPPVPDPEMEIMRGGNTTPQLIIAHPLETIEELTARLKPTGAEVAPLQINDKEWVLRISVPKHTDREAVKKILTNAGINVTGDPPYRITLKTPEG